MTRNPTRFDPPAEQAGRPAAADFTDVVLKVVIPFVDLPSPTRVPISRSGASA